MLESPSNSYSEDELIAEFDQLFPQGFAGPDVLQELAPSGWENSPLLAVFHPTMEQIHEESVFRHRNLAELCKPENRDSLPPEPTLEDLAKDWKETPVETTREVRELVGQCLWDVFSDSHEVFASDGRLLDLGSFRGSGGFLADLLNRQTETESYDYLNFYMGTIWVAQRVDLGPVYQMIFRRLRKRRLDWSYSFPRLYAVDLSPLKEVLEEKEEPDWLNYSPDESFAIENEEKERQQQLVEMRGSLDEGYREGIEEALKGPPPPTVQAYRAVYGRFPRGWPPSV